jgi:hypothetical protein
MESSVTIKQGHGTTTGDSVAVCSAGEVSTVASTSQAMSGATVLVPKPSLTAVGSTAAMFVPRLGSVQLPTIEPRKIGDTATPVRFVIAQTVAGAVASTQLSGVGNQTSVVGIGQQAVIVSPAIASSFIAASPRKLVPVLPAGGLRPPTRPAIAVVSGRSGTFAPVIQPLTLTRSPAKVSVTSAPRAQAGAGQVITLVATSVGANSAVKASPLSPFKVVIRPSTGVSKCLQIL